MLSPRWRKVLRDLWGNKARTVLVVLSIAVGVFAVGMIAGSQSVFSRGLNDTWASANPPSAVLYTMPFDDEFLWAVRNMPEVEEADGRRSMYLRFKANPQAEQWRNIELYTYPDYDDIRVQEVWPERGAWPPPEKEVLIERSSLAWMGVQEGDTILVEAPNGRLRELPIAGTAHDIGEMDASWNDFAVGYIAVETLEWFGLPRSFDELNIVVTGDKTDLDRINRVAQEVRERVEKSGRTVYGTWIPTPGKHPAEEVVQPMILLLGALGLLSLLLSGFLVVNTLQALLAQQIRQIGIMKAVGGRNGQIMGVYYIMVLIYSLLALAIAIPLGALGAQAMVNYMANLLNFDLEGLTIPLSVLGLEIGVGLVVPLLAALYPILSGVRVPAREAMSDYGLSSTHFGQGLLDRLLERVRGLSRPMLLSLRNTFRRKGRLALTLATLTLGGAIFMAVFSVRASLLLTLEDMFEYVDYDALVGFRRGYRIEQIEREALEVPGVVAAEAWRFGNTRRIRPDDTESDTIWLRAPRADSELVNPTVVEGRWLLPEDESAVVINTQLLKDEPDVKLGDDIVLKVDGDETIWRIVGIIKGTPPIPMVYVNLPYYSQIEGGVGRAGVVFVKTEQHDTAYQEQVAKAMEEHFESFGFQVDWRQTSNSERARSEAQFNVLIMFLLIMAVLLAVVGGIGLMGTMSLNVLERTREIGVMRAIGASDGAVLQIVIVEGLLIGTLSWLVGAALALPLGKALSDIVGYSIMQAELSYNYSVEGVGLWLALVLILAALASFWPARNASRVTVRDVLAYE
jgi:putative ABC transport system permease protein